MTHLTGWHHGHMRPEGHEEREREKKAAEERIRHQTTWVDLQIRQAIERGAFDDLPGAGKPIPDLGVEHDPDWWVKKLVEREQITGVLPEALQLRVDDQRLDGVLDRLAGEREVRRELEDFNARIVQARRQLQGGPPVITPLRDVEEEVRRWRQRRRPTARPAAPSGPPAGRRRWPFRRGRAAGR